MTFGASSETYQPDDLGSSTCVCLQMASTLLPEKSTLLSSLQSLYICEARVHITGGV